MYNTNLAVKDAYEPVMAALPNRKTDIKAVTRQKLEIVTPNAPVLLPKEEYCCNMATD